MLLLVLASLLLPLSFSWADMANTISLSLDQPKTMSATQWMMLKQQQRGIRASAKGNSIKQQYTLCHSRSDPKRW
jgi:hypothetical protein